MRVFINFLKQYWRGPTVFSVLAIPQAWRGLIWFLDLFGRAQTAQDIIETAVVGDMIAMLLNPPTGFVIGLFVIAMSLVVLDARRSQGALMLNTGRKKMLAGIMTVAVIVFVGASVFYSKEIAADGMPKTQQAAASEPLAPDLSVPVAPQENQAAGPRQQPRAQGAIDIDGGTAYLGDNVFCGYDHAVTARNATVTGEGNRMYRDPRCDDPPKQK